MSKEDNPLAKEQAQIIPVKRELASLIETVTRQGNELNLLREAQSYNGPPTKPNEPTLRELWNLVYTSLINKVFERGPVFWNNKSTALRNELQLCVIRADEAVENYIAVRNTCPDPVCVAQERWAKEQLLK